MCSLLARPDRRVEVSATDSPACASDCQVARLLGAPPGVLHVAQEECGTCCCLVLHGRDAQAGDQRGERGVCYEPQVPS